MTPAATPSAPATPRGGRWLSGVVTFGYLGVVAWIALGRPPLRLSLLHTIMRTLQRIAGWVGAAGLHTEAAYRNAVDNHRGGA